MNLSTKIKILSLVTLICIAVDQWTKALAVKHLVGKGVYSWFYDSFRLVYSENTGAFLGLGGQLSATTRFWLLAVLVSLVLLFVLIYMLRSAAVTRPGMIALSLIFSGGASNLYDRFTNANGAVIDFMNMGIGSLRTGIFNVADMAILGGVIFLIILEFRRKPA